MDKEEKKEKKRSWRDVVAGRNPDLNLDDDEAVAAYMQEQWDDYDKLQGERNQLNDLLVSSPQAAGILQGLSSGVGDDGRPFSLMGFMFRNYWDVIQKAKTEEEAVKMAKEMEAENIARAAEAEARKKNNASKLEAMDDALTEAMKSVNTDEATVNRMLEWLYGKDDGIIYRVVRYELNKDDFEKLLYAFNRDSELDGARKDGERNSRSGRGMPHRSFKDNMPADLGGGGSESRLPEDEDPTIAHYRKMGKRKFS